MQSSDIKRRQLFFSITLVFAVFCVLAEALYLPSLTQIAQDFNALDPIFDTCTWVLYFGVAISIVAHGFIADYFGRIAASISGYTFVMAGTLLCLFANDPQELLLATFILAFGLGSSVLLCRIFARDLFQGEAFVQMLSLVSVCTLLITPLAPWIAHALLPNSPWQTFFLWLFAIVCALFALSQRALSDHRLRRIVNHHYSRWSLKSLACPSVALAITLASLNAAIVFLFQAAAMQIFSGLTMVAVMSLPPIATLLSTVLFLFSHSWRIDPFRYILHRQSLAFLGGLLGAIAWNQLQAPWLFLPLLLFTLTLQSNTLSVATVYLLQDKISIGLSASLVSAVQHGAIGVALLSMPMTLRNSPKDLLILIPVVTLMVSPILKVAKFLSPSATEAAQEHEIRASLST